MYTFLFILTKDVSVSYMDHLWKPLLIFQLLSFPLYLRQVQAYVQILASVMCYEQASEIRGLETFYSALQLRF